MVSFLAHVQTERQFESMSVGVIMVSKLDTSQTRRFLFLAMPAQGSDAHKVWPLDRRKAHEFKLAHRCLINEISFVKPGHNLMNRGKNVASGLFPHLETPLRKLVWASDPAFLPLERNCITCADGASPRISAAIWSPTRFAASISKLSTRFRI
jgi:hypothetical protein